MKQMTPVFTTLQKIAAPSRFATSYFACATVLHGMSLFMASIRSLMWTLALKWRFEPSSVGIDVAELFHRCQAFHRDISAHNFLVAACPASVSSLQAASKWTFGLSEPCFRGLKALSCLRMRELTR